jgi:quercetin dioxygenase-like cupin family protein
MLSGNENGFRVRSGEGRIHGHIELRGTLSVIVDVKISGNDTGGELAIFEQTSFMQGRGWPLHLHLSQDKTIYISEGEYLFVVGDEKYNLRAGDHLFLPRKVPHAWSLLSETGKAILTMQPAGKLEAFFLEVAALTYDPTPATIDKLFENHDMKVVGPGLRIDEPTF